ncbi:hypothetical protein MJL33_29205, partial [Salmonella enterica subsp. enterica serovar Kentucky]|nr:hypothetical protein [Salmonella enterica subsp. enterica serovar Kentucky]
RVEPFNCSSVALASLGRITRSPLAISACGDGVTTLFTVIPLQSERRPDLIIRSLRGNVGTRLGKLDNGDYDAIILAVAGLKRLGL